ncbi:MAG TPA: histidine kinase dimerization/phospho-acceptor domain-containing protein, partial [Candidatus Dormibacteraeota bacterium]
MGLAPQELANRLEGVIFMLICLVALCIVAAGDLLGRSYGTVSPLGLVPVALTGWLLSRRWIAVVVVVAMALRIVIARLGIVTPLTALSQMIVIPLIAVVSHLAATTALQSRQSAKDVRSARASEKRARGLERAKSDFMRLASHELRAPLAVVRGYLAMLDEGSLGHLPPPAEQVIPILAANTAAMGRM